MRRGILISIFTITFQTIFAHNPIIIFNGFQFEVINEVSVTDVKNQYKSSTCWSFSSISFLESELMRLNKGSYDLSEMWIVRNTYDEKAEKFVRMHGSINFTGGGALNDVIDMINKYGIVPDEVYTGLEIGESKHIHGEMDNLLKDYVEGVIENKNKKLTPVWKEGYDKILDTYLGNTPEKFKYKGKKYTPVEFANSLGLNMDDYVLITSFTHHPFYEKFVLEVPDNWSWGKAYNLPLDELIQVFDSALTNNYSIAWASDVSEKGFSWRNGIAVVPDIEYNNLSGSDREKWDKLSPSEKETELFSFEKPVKEMQITQDLRQKAFDNYETTDDHGMHIVGISIDQNGKKYYKVKNSWGTDNPFDGYLFVSEAYVKYKTVSALVNKNSIPKEIREKLEL